MGHNPTVWSIANDRAIPHASFVEPRDPRYGWAADDPRWTEQPDGSRDAWPRQASTEPAPSLWPDANGNDTTTEYNTESWLPQQRPPTWSVVHDERWGPPPDRWGQDPSASTLPLAPLPPPLYGASGLPNPPSQNGAVRPGYGLVTPPTRAQSRRTPLEGWSRRPRRQRRGQDDDSRRHARSSTEPAYGMLLGLTVCWYAVPGLLYVIWLLTAGTDRAGPTARQFLGNLPWLLAAVTLSLAVAALLRWAIVGWRAMTLSFAAAIIGAGVATIAHSLTL